MKGQGLGSILFPAQSVRRLCEETRGPFATLWSEGQSRLKKTAVGQPEARRGELIADQGAQTTIKPSADPWCQRHYVGQEAKLGVDDGRRTLSSRWVIVLTALAAVDGHEHWPAWPALVPASWSVLSRTRNFFVPGWGPKGLDPRGHPDKPR